MVTASGGKKTLHCQRQTHLRVAACYPGVFNGKSTFNINKNTNYIYDKVSDGVMIWVPLEVKKGHASFGLYNLVMVPKT